MQQAQKICSKCQRLLAADRFYEGRAACKECIAAQVAAWNKANRDKRQASEAKWRKANPEKRRASAARYAKEHPEKIKARSNTWQRNNPKKANANKAKWAKAHRKEITASQRVKRQSNPERHRAKAAKWAKANPEKIRLMNSHRIEASTDAYVTDLLRNATETTGTGIQFPQALIEAKRTHLKLKRAIKERQK
jgi:hypothetical protein